MTQPTSDPIVLYRDTFSISPYFFSCHIALVEKGLSHDERVVPLESLAQASPDYRDRSLTGRVPALQHGDFWLSESSAIVDYLEDAFPDTPRLLPVDVRQRARARQILAWVRSDLMPLRDERPTTTMFYERASTPLSSAGENAASKLVRVAELLVADGATTLFGAFSIADADLAFMLHRLLLSGHDVPDKVRQYASAIWQRPSIAAFVHRERAPYVPYAYT